MRLPYLQELDTARQMTDVFRGYNHNLRIRDGEFYDMKNLSSDNYPVLAPRAKRGTYAAASNPQGLIAKDALLYVDDGTVYYNGYAVAGLTLTRDGVKQIVSMGAYAVFFPDKKYLNTADLSDYGSLEASWSLPEGGSVQYSLCTVTGESYGTPSVQATAPQNPEAGALWIDTSGEVHTLHQWSASSGMWVQIPTVYTKISAAGIGAAFSEYDGVEISGCSYAGTGALSAQIDALNGPKILYGRGDDDLIVVGILDQAWTQTEGTVTVKRTVPDMDFVCEAGNRLWGCKYGLVNGETVNEIYGCKLGDFKNWNCFLGISTDSWVGSVGTDGQFTGAVTHLGYPIFFKENGMHKVYISSSGAHSIQDTACRGVQKGCEKSLAIVGEVLYYKARSGVCAYDGSLPTEISSAFGEEVYGNAVGGSHGNKYYISMEDAAGTWHLFVYDAAKGLWHREDSTRADAFCSCRGELYYIDHDGGKIRTELGSGETDTLQTEWMAETGILGTEEPDRKYISRLTIRMALCVGSRVVFKIQYDSSGIWEQVFSVTGSNLRSFSVPIRPRRCDHLRLRIEGAGDAKIFSIAKTIEIGSDIG